MLGRVFWFIDFALTCQIEFQDVVDEPRYRTRHDNNVHAWVFRLFASLIQSTTLSSRHSFFAKYNRFHRSTAEQL
jgi:hypothetical protein